MASDKIQLINLPIVLLLTSLANIDPPVFCEEMVGIARYNCQTLLQTARHFSVKFVLEVLGAGGAIWGSSEAIGLRNDENRWFFRWLACLLGFVFLVRWVVQLHRACRMLSRGDRRIVLSQMIDDVEVDDDLELYQEEDEQIGNSKEMLSPRGKKNQRGFDTTIDRELDTTLDDSYGTSVNDSTMGF